MDNGNVIRPLILDESENEAEALASSLRNAGFAVRHKYIENDEALQEAIDGKSWDLLITASQVGDLNAKQAISIIKQSGKDIPCIVYGSDRTDDTVVDLIRSGAADFVSESAPEHLLLVIQREFYNLRERREHRVCQNLHHESEKRNRVLLDSSRDSIAYIHEGMHIYANQSYQDIFGYDDLEELESVPIMDLIASDHQQNFKDVLRRLSDNEPPEEALEYLAMHQDGETFTATMEFSRASIDGEACTQVMIHRKSDNKALEKEIEQLRQQDLLTGLFNHHHFMELVQNAVKRATGGEHESALLYIEPDNFRNIKDTLGITGSDLVLTDIANLLKEQSPEGAVLARYAGTVFAILLDDAQQKDAEKLAEQLCLCITEKIFDVEGKTATTSCSIGLVKISETSTDAKKSLTQAETACNLAKDSGGNRTHVFSVEDELASLEADKRIITLVKLALKNNRFQLQYQPIVSLHAEPGERYEVLIRLLGQNDEVIMPGEFLTAATQAGLMTDIDRWVIKSAAKAILDKRKLGKELQFFIKISAASLRDPSTLLWISKLLQAARLHGDCLVFEIREQDALENLKAAKVFSSGLNQLNCNFAIDHAGKDSTDMAYLKHLDLSYLKIDGSHIENASSEESQEAIKLIAESGRNFGFLTIAEHVQDPTCLGVLWQHGVNFIQGYYLQHPKNNLNYDFSNSD